MKCSVINASKCSLEDDVSCIVLSLFLRYILFFRTRLQWPETIDYVATFGIPRNPSKNELEIILIYPALTFESFENTKMRVPSNFSIILGVNLRLPHFSNMKPYN